MPDTCSSIPRNTAPDFAALWRSYKTHDARGRVDAAVDLAFWEQAAPTYDHSHQLYPGVMAVLESVIAPDSTVLDVGAGTGRFSLPLALRARHVTALDYSPAMLNILQHKKAQQQLENVSVVEAAWEAAVVEPHDVVLAAWSLYRHVDILSALQKLIDATRCTLVIVESDDDGPQYPHHHMLSRIWGPPPFRQVLSKYLVFLGALWQLGVYADVHVVYETSHRMTESAEHLARQLAPATVTPAQLERFAQGLTPLLKPEVGQWRYDFTHPIEILVWHRPESWGYQ